MTRIADPRQLAALVLDDTASEVATTAALNVRVAGIPIPQGSMRAFTRRGGGPPIVTSDNPRLRAWRNDVTAALSEARAERQWSGPIRVVLRFALPRPASHYGKRGLLPSAPPFPIGARDDVDKLARAILDSATGAGVWRDDGQVVDVDATKRWAEPESGPGVLVRLEVLR